ncbi:hypothetical protein HG530_011176 [Fusarium avenaceum]|nr:hypothetical protein HG530_011176 [Fusarium avenaceum]
MSGSRGEANFVWKCKNCKRESSASIKSGPAAYEQTEPAKPRKILEFDCRGLEFVEFKAEGEWLAEGAETGTKFKAIELEEGEWFEYDEKSNEEVSINDVNEHLGWATCVFLSEPTSRIGLRSVSKKVPSSNSSEFEPRFHLARLKDCRRSSYFNKMAVSELPGTIEFLTDAAHLLRTTAPETSAHLMSHRGQLLQQYGIAISDIQQQHTCGGCGLIMIPGQEATLKIDARRSTQKKTKGAKAGAGSTPKHTPSTERPCKTFHCDNCERDTKIPLPAPGPALTPDEFFQTIGDKVKNFAPAAEGVEDADDERAVEEIESLCMNCGKNGMTRLLLTMIPYFREVVIMSFSCEHCNLQNNEIQAAGSFQPKGTHYELRLTNLADFSRQVVKSDTSTVKFIELDLEIPAGRGQLTNVEGLLTTVIDDLEMGQEARKEQVPELYPKIAEIIAKGRAMLNGESFPFRVWLDDPAGNSFIAPDLKDGVGKWEKHEYARTPEQNAALGISDSDANAREALNPGLTADGDVIPNEVYSFPATCPGCMRPCTTHMKMVDIPHFKQVVLMSTVCDDCGYRSNDVKTGGEIPEKGEKIVLDVKSSTDLGRDILKSETCGLECPELKLQVNPGTLGGRFTTVEGLLTQVRGDLHSQIFEGVGQGGDSLASNEKSEWTAFFDGLDAAIRGEKTFTIILTDPFASSYVQPLVDPPAPDPAIHRESYTRTDEEEEELGLKDMKLENYGENDEEEKKDGEEKKTEDAAER